MEAAPGVNRWTLVAQDGTPTPIDHTNAQPGNTERQIKLSLSGTAVLVAPDGPSRDDILNERNQNPNAR